MSNPKPIKAWAVVHRNRLTPEIMFAYNEAGKRRADDWCATWGKVRRVSAVLITPLSESGEKK